MHKFKIFIVHYKPLKERKEYIDSFLSNTSLPYEYSTKFTRDNIDESFFSDNIDDINRKNSITTTPVPPDHLNITKPIKANMLEHLEIYRKIIKEDLDYALVLEDDAVFIDNFIEKLTETINYFPEDWDTIYATNGCENRPDLITDRNFVKKDIFYKSLNRWSWTGGAYFIKQKTAKLFLENIKPIVYPPDYELTYLQNLLNSNVYWLGDPIIYEGSNPVSGKYCRYNSSVER